MACPEKQGCDLRNCDPNSALPPRSRRDGPPWRETPVIPGRCSGRSGRWCPGRSRRHVALSRPDGERPIAPSSRALRHYGGICHHGERLGRLDRARAPAVVAGQPPGGDPGRLEQEAEVVAGTRPLRCGDTPSTACPARNRRPSQRCGSRSTSRTSCRRQSRSPRARRRAASPPRGRPPRGAFARRMPGSGPRTPPRRRRGRRRLPSFRLPRRARCAGEACLWRTTRARVRCGATRSSGRRVRRSRGRPGGPDRFPPGR
jgi:hypothetical protein